MSTIITPKRGDNHLLKGAKKLYKKLGEGEIMNMEGGKQVGQYNGEELPNTSQGRRIRWTLGRQRYIVLDENGKELSQESLDELVKNCYLSFEDGAKVGELITTANPANRKDPFFNHKQLYLKLNEGTAAPKTEFAGKDKLMVYGLRSSNDFASGKDNLRSGAVKYIISDKGEDSNANVNKMTKERQAIKLLEALNNAKKLRISKILGLGVNNTNDPDTIDLQLYNAIRSLKVNADGLSLQQLFINLCSMDSEEFNLRHLVSAAMPNVIRKTKAGFTFRGNRIASTTEGLYDYFRKSENHEILLSLEEAMGKVIVDDHDEIDKTSV